MLYLWLKYIVCVVLAASLLVLFVCFSLAFAGGWVGPYAGIIEPAGAISFLTSTMSAAVALYLFKDQLFRQAGKPPVLSTSPPFDNAAGFRSPDFSAEIVTYSNFGGRVVSEARSGTNLDYVRDTLGPTAALADATQALSDTFQYWPYGEIASHVGSSNTPLTWVGTLGYYLDLLDKMYYVRARIERRKDTSAR